MADFSQRIIANYISRDGGEKKKGSYQHHGRASTPLWSFPADASGGKKKKKVTRIITLNLD